MRYIQNIFHLLALRISSFFAPRKQEPEFTIDREPFSAPAVATKTRTRKPKEQRTEIDGLPKETLSELLDHLDNTFATMKLPRDSASWLDRDTITGLRRMGVYVPHPWLMRWRKDPEHIRVDVTRKFPTIMSISLCVDTDKRNPDSVPANTMYAVKHERLPHYVSQLPGVAYQFGCSYRFGNGNFWIRCHLVVNRETGEVTICDELTTETHTVPIQKGRKNNGSKASYVRRLWKEPALVSGDEEWTREQRKILVINLFYAMFTWWLDRDSRWSVGVRSGKDRVVFSIEQQNTKTYFADRDKSIKTASGRAQKIIHYVRAHERIRGDKTVPVREHIRGIREFDWGKYHCIVTAPAFHKTMLTSDFDVSSMCEDDLAEVKRGETISASQLGAQLARIEERDTRGRQ